jgi:4-amino-4-deoxy-L-arabinose transferase-like glycosyltransferase
MDTLKTFSWSRFAYPVIFLCLLMLGLGLRLLNLTNPPIDFAPTRQLRDAIIARGMYYEMLPNADPTLRQKAITLWKFQDVLEPSILERIVAITYLVVGGESVWIARLYSIALWIIGGIVLYTLARRMTADKDTPAGALVGLAFYLISPFTVYASRSFQPDPMMVMWIVITAYAIYRWADESTWKWALLVGLFGGITVLIKLMTIFMIAAAIVCIALTIHGLKRAISNLQVWLMAACMIIIPSIYYWFGVRQDATSYTAQTLATLKLLLTPEFYVRWMIALDGIIGLAWVLAGAVGFLLLPPKGRALLLGLWIGFGLFGLGFSYRTMTHEYYNLPLFPIVALSLAPIASLVFTKLSRQTVFWKVIFAGVVILSVAYPAWIARSVLLGKNYRGEPGGWRRIGEALPKDGAIIALTHDYGERLQYYGWTLTDYWLGQADMAYSALLGKQADGFQQMFEEKTRGKRYFLVTLFNELEAQPQLKAMLYDHYPYTKGEGYILFDLAHPLDQTP